MDALYRHIKGDKVIWTIVLFLSLFSVLAVYSAINSLAYKYQHGNQIYYLVKHSLIIIVGLFLMYVIHRIKYSYFSRLSQIALFVSIPLLLLTLARGASLNEAARWLSIPGTGLTFQTSDFAKIALMSYLARILSKNQEKNYDLKETSLKIFLPVALVCGLILPANFSTCALLFTTSFIMMFVGRVKTKFLLTFVGMGLLGVLLIVLIGFTAPKVFPRFATWVKRIENFKDKDSKENFQADQAKIAIATGGITGKGPGKSTQRNMLPHPYSDFIFAFIIEEYGFIGGFLVVFLYLIFLFRGVRIATRSKKNFGSLLAFGLCFSLVFQAFINMAVATNLFPVTGQPLPLVSMGGTSIWFTSIAMGIILSVSTETESDIANEKV
jgi:cell division protein FtsW